MKGHFDPLRLLRNIILALGVIIIGAPMYLVVVNSFKTLQDAGKDFFGFSKSLYLGNYVELFQRNNYFVYVKNSAVISIVSVLLITLIIPLVSYSVARNFEKRYYKFVYRFLTLGLFIPSQVILLPTVIRMSEMSMQNLGGMTLLYLTFSFTQGIFLFTGYIRSTPIEIEEAARIDGCSVLQTYFRVVIHLIRPMIATLVIMNFLWIWNDFQLPLYILNGSPDKWTLPLFQYNFKTQYSFNYTMAFTAYIVSMVPVIVIYSIFQKHIISGLTAGAVKG